MKKLNIEKRKFYFFLILLRIDYTVEKKVNIVPDDGLAPGGVKPSSGTILNCIIGRSLPSSRMIFHECLKSFKRKDIKFKTSLIALKNILHIKKM